MSRLVYGVHPVEELLRSRGAEVSLIYLVTGDGGPAVRAVGEAARKARVMVETLPRAELDRLAGGGVH